MNDFQICLCGAMPGYPHTADCPRPSYNANDDAQCAQWETERAEIRRRHYNQAAAGYLAGLRSQAKSLLNRPDFSIQKFPQSSLALLQKLARDPNNP